MAARAMAAAAPPITHCALPVIIGIPAVLAVEDEAAPADDDEPLAKELAELVVANDVELPVEVAPELPAELPVTAAVEDVPVFVVKPDLVPVAVTTAVLAEFPMTPAESVTSCKYRSSAASVMRVVVADENLEDL